MLTLQSVAASPPAAAPSALADNTQRVLDLAGRLEASGLRERAITLLTEQRAALWPDAVSHADDLMAVETLLAKLTAHQLADIAPQARIRASEARELALAYQRAALPEKAAAAWDQALKTPGLPQGDHDALAAEQAAAELQAARAAHRSWAGQLLAEVWSTLKTIFGWAAILVGLGALAGFFAWLRSQRRPNDRTVLAVEDMSAATADRAVRSKQLTRAVLEEIAGLTSPSQTASRIDDVEEAGGAPVVLLQPASDSAQANLSVMSEDPVKLGPVTFNPRQLAGLVLAWLRRPDARTLAGALYTDGDTALITLEERRHRKAPNGQALPPQSVSCAGASPRADAIRRLASRIVFLLSPRLVTESEASFDAWAQAVRVLARPADDAPKQFEEARKLLEASISADPENVHARIRLGGVLRALGRAQAAVSHLRVAVEMLKDGAGGERLHSLRAAHPEIRYIARYNLAITLVAAESTWDENKKAVALLEEMLPELESFGSDLEAASWRDRLVVLTRSALASALVYQIHHAPASGRDDGNARQTFINATADRILALLAQIENQLADSRAEIAAKTAAQAVALNAAGHAWFSRGKRSHAEAHFRRALSLQPGFAEPRVKLAQLLLDGGLTDLAELSECRSLLQEALKSQPDSEIAHRLIGRLLALDHVADYEAAVQELRKGGEDPWTLHRISQLLREKLGRPAESLAPLLRSIGLARKTDFRHIEFVDTVLSLPNDAANVPWLHHALDLTRKLEHAPSEKLRARGRSLASAVRWRLGYQCRDENIARAESRLKELTPPPSAPGAPAHPAELVQATAKAELAVRRLRGAGRTNWSAVAVEVDDALLALRMAIAEAHLPVPA